MALLKNTTVETSLSVDGNIQHKDGSPAIDLDSLPDDARYYRQIITQVDTVDRSTDDTWTLGPTFDNITDCKTGSLIYLFYSIPLRNDLASTWGGAYIEPQIRYNTGTWYSLGSSGHIQMYRETGSICTYNNTILIEPSVSGDFSIQFRFYYRAYSSSTLEWNQRRNINNTNSFSGTASLLPGLTNDNHFYAHIKVKELALVRGT